MVAGLHAPDTRNYLLGKGVLMFRPEGEDDYFALGNVPSCTITPTVEILEHFSSMEAESVKDDTVIQSKSGEITITLEEFTANNLSLLLLGTVDEGDYGDEVVVDLFSRTSFTGSLIFVATNAKGPRWRLDLPKVTFNPSGGFSPISEEYAQMELTGSWESSGGDFGTATLRPAQGVAAPENILLPFIGYSGLNVGDELEVFHGLWVDASSFTYVWKNAGIAIATPAEEEKTYTIRAGDVGDSITCTITVTNSVGSTPLTTAAVVPVA